MSWVTKEEYSPFKVVHHRDKLLELSTKKQTTPLQVQIIPSNVCNQSCSFCAYRMHDSLSNQNFNEKDIIPFAKLIETIDCCKELGVKAIQYTGGGEPLVYPKALEMLDYTISSGLGLALVTNGAGLNEKSCDLLGDSDWNRISVDAFSPELYSTIRHVPMAVHAKVINNIRSLVRYKRRNTIGVGFVVCKENYMEVFEAAKFFKEIGVDNLRISAAFTPMGHAYFGAFEDVAAELCAKASLLSDSNFTVFNLFGDRTTDTANTVQDYDYCGIKELLTYIGADQNVYTCCTLAYNAAGYIGSIKDQSFSDLWLGAEKTSMFTKHNPRKHCRNFCMYRNKNNFINYCIKDDPQHVYYV